MSSWASSTCWPGESHRSRSTTRPWPTESWLGMPERDPLVAARLADGDDEFASMFADYVTYRARAADEPIDSRVFELVDGELVPLASATPT